MIKEVDRVDAVAGPCGLAVQEGLQVVEVDRTGVLDVDRVSILLAGLRSRVGLAGC